MADDGTDVNLDVGGGYLGTSTGLDVTTPVDTSSSNLLSDIGINPDAMFNSLTASANTDYQNLLNSIASSSPSTSSNTASAAIATSLLNDANQLAKIVLTPGGSYSITNPLTGAVTTYQGTGQPSAPLNLSSAFGTSLGSLSGILPILLIGGLGIFLVSQMGKTR